MAKPNELKIAGVRCEWRWYRGQNDRWTLHRKSNGSQVAEVVQHVLDGIPQRDRSSGKLLRAVFLEGETIPFCTDMYIGCAKSRAERELEHRWSSVSA